MSSVHQISRSECISAVSNVFPACIMLYMEGGFGHIYIRAELSGAALKESAVSYLALALFTCRTGWQVDECSNQIGQRSLCDCSREMFHASSPRLAFCRLHQLSPCHTSRAGTVNEQKLFFIKLKRISCSKSFFRVAFFYLYFQNKPYLNFPQYSNF